MSSPVEPARLKPGITLDSLAQGAGQRTGGVGDGRMIEGEALIFWDPKRAGEKLAAIDTDQITPAADCVSESLETLDERWKAGSFRYLMPDFRARVHAGQTFVVAGQRFAIGSSREMSPAGLKGVAEEAGLEMVILCGENMGDIFRRNALNLRSCLYRLFINEYYFILWALVFAIICTCGLFIGIRFSNKHLDKH
jgi:hypothetical protein